MKAVILTGMSQQVRAAALLREAAAILDVGTTSSNPSTTCSVTTSSATSTNMTQISNATRVLFGPYRNMRPFQRPNRRAGHLEAAVSHWTHKFSVIPRCKEVKSVFTKYFYNIIKYLLWSTIELQLLKLERVHLTP